MARYREFLEAQNKRKPKNKRSVQGPEATSRSAIRSEYFRKPRAQRVAIAKAQKAQLRLI